MKDFDWEELKQERGDGGVKKRMVCARSGRDKGDEW